MNMLFLQQEKDSSLALFSMVQFSKRGHSTRGNSEQQITNQEVVLMFTLFFLTENSEGGPHCQNFIKKGEELFTKSTETAREN